MLTEKYRPADWGEVCAQDKAVAQLQARENAAYVRGIAELEGLNGQSIEKYERLLKDSGNSIRAALQAVENGAMAST